MGTKIDVVYLVHSSVLSELILFPNTGIASTVNYKDHFNKTILTKQKFGILAIDQQIKFATLSR